MRTVSEFAMSEESTNVASAMAVSAWLAEALSKVADADRPSAALQIFHGDATTYLRLNAPA